MRIARFVAAAAVGLAFLAACGKSSSTRSPAVGAPTDTLGFLTFQQNIPLVDTGTDVPGITNTWDLNHDLTLEDGGDDQFDGALELYVGTLTTSPPTYESVYAEVWDLPVFGDLAGPEDVQFYTPMVQAGLLAAVAYTDSPISGTTSASLPPWVSGRLSQAIDLTTTTGTIQFSANRFYYVYSDLSDPAAAWRVRFLNPTTGAVLKVIEEYTTGSATGTLTADISDLAGQRVVLAFDNHSDDEAGVDNVSIKDDGGAGAERVANGDFETGDLTGWTATVTAEQPSGLGNVTAQTVSDLEVTRAFYTTPTSYWGRWVDSFHNPGTSDVTRDVIYYSDLGSDNCGIIYDTPGATGAVTSWDGDGSDRDVALVAGSGTTADTILYQTATSLGGCEGSDYVFMVHQLTVPAGGTVSLAHYIVMTGVDTGSLDTTTDATALATLADEWAKKIVKNYGSDPTLRDGMTADQRSTIANF